jgi:hypothetical protein
MTTFDKLFFFALRRRECPAGWFLCRGLCYTLVQRNNRGPWYTGNDGNEFYTPDFMGVEARCGLCGKSRVAFIGEDEDMQRMAAEAARQTINEDKVRSIVES